jgi:hypothetical protein
MMRIQPGTSIIIAVNNSVLILIRMAIVLFEKSKDIYRRQKGIGQMAYMHVGLIMRLSGAFYIFKARLQGHGKSDLALFLFEKIVVRLVPFSKTVDEFCRCTKTRPVQAG